MARVFTKLGREITIAVRVGGPDPDTNPRLCVLVQTTKKKDMPEENMERTIKEAVDKGSNTDYRGMNYEGCGSHGIVIFVETAANSTTHTAANVCSYFSEFGGSPGTTGSLEFLFNHHYVFHARPKAEADQEGLILDLIGYGAKDIEQDEEEWVIKGSSSQNDTLQAKSEGLGFETSSAELIRVLKDARSVSAEEREGLNKPIERLEEDEDIQDVFTNMGDEEE